MISTQVATLLRSSCRTFKSADVVGVNNRFAVVAKFSDRAPLVVQVGITQAGHAGAIVSETESIVSDARVAAARGAAPC